MIRPTVLPDSPSPADLKTRPEGKPEVKPDDAVVKWRNTPFKERLDMLVDGKQPDWIKNPGSRMAWLKRQLRADDKGEMTPGDQSKPKENHGVAGPALAPMGRPEAPAANAIVALETVAAQLSARVLAARFAPLDIAGGADPDYRPAA